MRALSLHHTMATHTPDRPKAASPQSLSGLKPFLRPYTPVIAAAALFLLLAAAATLAFPWALRELIDVNPHQAMVDTIEARDGSAIRESVSPDYDRLRTFISHR